MKISITNINRYLNWFERAVRAHEMKGSQHPEDHPAIQREYDAAKRNLRQFMIESIIVKKSND